MTINQIISSNFHDADDDVPAEILEIIDKFFEIEDTGTYGESSKDKMYEQILKNALQKFEEAKRKKVMTWCKEQITNDWKR